MPATTPATAAAAKAAATTKRAAAPASCVKSYTVVKGDFWVRIASKSGITLREVLAANNAEKDTLLLPGKTVCLPANATVPAAAAAPAAPAATPAPAAPVACTKTYTIVKGDAWSTIASRSKITTTQLLAANNATTKTVLLPGKTVCLPANATTPPPPTTQAPTTTTPKPVLKTYTKAEVQQIIRDVFPDELEAYAFVVADRESRFNQYSANSCCYGVFQINFNAHRKWLVNYGVTSPPQLLDPVGNIKMANIVYHRSNGWGPWGG